MKVKSYLYSNGFSLDVQLTVPPNFVSGIVPVLSARGMVSDLSLMKLITDSRHPDCMQLIRNQIQKLL